MVALGVLASSVGNTDVLSCNVSEFQLFMNNCQYLFLALCHGFAAVIRTELDKMKVFSPAILIQLISSFPFIFQSVVKGNSTFLKFRTFALRFLQSLYWLISQSTLFKYLGSQFFHLLLRDLFCQKQFVVVNFFFNIFQRHRCCTARKVSLVSRSMPLVSVD